MKKKYLTGISKPHEELGEVEIESVHVVEPDVI